MHLAYVNVFVTDLPRAVAFYRETLGLALQYASPEHGYASLSAGAVRLGVAVPGEAETQLIGRHTGLGFEVADLEATHARLSAAGVHFSMPPTRQPWGAFMALLSDPDNNVFYLDQEADGSRA